MRTTVYIPCRNAGKYIEKTLRAVLGQTRAADEVLVVDEGSTDRTGEIARSLGVRVVEQDDKAGVGLAAGRNLARRSTTGDILIGLDSDAVPAPDYVANVCDTFEQRPDVGGVCGRLVEAHSVLLPDRWRQVHMAQHHGDRPIDGPRICYGAVSSFQVAAIDAVGGWNEKYRTNYEDVDLTNRLRAAGVKTAYEPAIIARHQRRDTLDTVLSGFNNWFTPAGRDAGHFASWEAWRTLRFEPAIWGIFNHRFSLDQARHRAHLLGPTFLLPWWMTLHDWSELGSAAEPAEMLVCEAAEFLKSVGASDYIACLTQLCLDRLQKRLPWSGKAGNGPNGLVADVFDFARSRMPDNALTWGQIEFSFCRLGYEAKLGVIGHGNYRVLVANPPWYTPSRQGVRAGSRWSFSMDRRGDEPVPRYVPFPFFLAQAAEMLSKKHVANAIVDGIAEGLSFDEFHERANGYAPSAILMETSAASFENDVAIWRRLRSDLPNAKIILCGPHATARRREILDAVPEVDIVLIGEYEQTAVQVIERLSAERAIADIKGVAYRGDVQAEIIDLGRPDPVPFDDVGNADRLRLPLYAYRDAFGGVREPVVQMMATRGCPYECNFCQWPQVFYERRKIQKRSASRVFAEAQELIGRFGFKTVYFDDDMFSPGKEWIAEFTRLIREGGLSFDWSIMARADVFTEEQLHDMAGAGLRAAKFGVESGDQAMVDAMGKRLDLNRLRETVRVCRDAGISVHLTFTVGLPGETRETLRKTRELILELMPNTLQISRAMPLPGTAFEDWAVETGAMKTKDVSARDGFLLSIINHGDLGAEEIDAFIRESYAEYQQRKTIGCETTSRECKDNALAGRSQ